MEEPQIATVQRQGTEGPGPTVPKRRFLWPLPLSPKGTGLPTDLEDTSCAWYRLGVRCQELRRSQMDDGWLWYIHMAIIYLLYVYIYISYIYIYHIYNISWYTMVYPGIDPSEWPMAVSIFTEASLSNSACRCGMMQPSRSKSDTLMKNDEQCNLCLPRSQEPSNRAKAWVVLMVTRCHQHTRSKNPNHRTSSNVLGRRASAESWTAPLACQTHQCLLNEHP